MSDAPWNSAQDELADLPTPEPLTNLLLDRVRRSGDRVITYTKQGGRWVGHTWREGMVRIEETALGLLELGVERGDKVAILSGTRQEWGMCDLAILSIGAVTVGLYPTLTPEQLGFLLDHSEAKVVFVENDALRDRVTQALEGRASSVRVIQIEGRAAGPETLDIESLRRRGALRKQQNP